MNTSQVALLSTVRVKGENEREKAVGSLRRLNEFLRLPPTQCATSAYFTSVAQKGSSPTLVGRIEIFPNESILAAAQGSEEYKSYYESVQRQELFEEEESITRWQLAGGFLKRKSETLTNKAGVLILAKFTCNDNVDAVQNLVNELQKYCDWVESNEPSTYTYCVMTSKNASKEVLLFERYMDLPSVKKHGKTKEFKAMFQSISPWIKTNLIKITQWNELEGSFVSVQDIALKGKL